MRYESRITAYDCLDQVVVAVSVYGIDDDDPPRSQRLLIWSRQYPGRGELDPGLWITQLLQQTVRDLQTSENRRPMDAGSPSTPHTVTDVADTRTFRDR
jgi:hypothetical protein